MVKMIKIGVVGAGKFGGYHIGKCTAHPGVEYIGVFDKNDDAANAQSAKVGGRVFKSPAALFKACDAVIIAAPATAHGQLAIAALEQGLHILVEKPLATTLADATRIADLADIENLCVLAGHQERYVARAIGLGDVPEQPLLIKAQRLNPFSPRGTDTSVTLDLMTHDIDLVNWLMGGSPHLVTGQTFKERTAWPDHSFAELSYESGLAFLEASRLAEVSQRILEITYPSGTVRVDLNAKTLINDTPFNLNKNFADMPDARDSLAAGMNEFVSAITHKRTAFISALDGLEAVKIAQTIDQN